MSQQPPEACGSALGRLVVGHDQRVLADARAAGRRLEAAALGQRMAAALAGRRGEVAVQVHERGARDVALAARAARRRPGRRAVAAVHDPERPARPQPLAQPRGRTSGPVTPPDAVQPRDGRGRSRSRGHARDGARPAARAAAAGGPPRAGARGPGRCSSKSRPAASAAPTSTSSTASSPSRSCRSCPAIRSSRGWSRAASASPPGERVGVPWLGWTDGTCRYCRSGRENLCDNARFTGYDIDGGYAERAVADERFCFPLPEGYEDLHVAPLLCAGLIGYRTLRLAGDAERLGIYGFGAAAHIVCQVARPRGPPRVRLHARGRRGDPGLRARARRGVGRRRARAASRGARCRAHLRAGRRARPGRAAGPSQRAAPSCAAAST